MADAPVCHVNVQSPIADPKGRKLPTIPRATDLSSALAAIEAIRQTLLALTGQMAQRPPAPPAPLVQQGARITIVQGGGSGQTQTTGANRGGGGFNTRRSNSSPERPDVARWDEVQRVTQKKRIFNKDDKEQFVDVVRINKLVMRDSVTGEQWVFEMGNVDD